MTYPRFPMLRAAGALALVAMLACACNATSKSKQSASSESEESESEPAPKKKKKTKPSAAVAETAPPAASSAAVPLSPAEIVQKKFSGEPLPGTPRPIFKANLPSGIIVIVPPEYEAGAGSYGDGYQTEIVDKANPNMPWSESFVSAFAVPKKEYPFDPGSTVGLAVGIRMKQDKWEDPVPVSIGPDPIAAKVRRGTGVSIHSKKPWEAWCLSAEHKGRVIGVCGGWQSDKPELEEKVVSILKSVREGKAAPTDRGQP